MEVDFLTGLKTYITRNGTIVSIIRRYENTYIAKTLSLPKSLTLTYDLQGNCINNPKFDLMEALLPKAYA